MASKLVMIALPLVLCYIGQTANGAPCMGLFGFELLIAKLELLEEKLYGIERSLKQRQPNDIFKSCSEEPSKISGKYRLQPTSVQKSFVGFCEQEVHDGEWLVIQHRFDGSVNFYRDWQAYREGFGRTDGEFWIGLERLYRLTKDRSVTLMIEIEDYDGNYGYATYKGFVIGSESEWYMLKQLGAYQGTIDDGMRSNVGQGFTTRDMDNDNADENCAQEEGGAWWYLGCGQTNPNGPYQKQGEWQKIYWYPFNKGVELKFFRMMIK